MTTTRGRPKGIARQIAEETGLSVRTVQRALATKPNKPETEEEQRLRRFLEALRNFATFCRDNDPKVVSGLRVTDEQAEKVRDWNAIAMAWLQRLNDQDQLEARPAGVD